MAVRKKGTGFTLIEVMVVVIIMAMIMAGVGFSLGATQRAKLRSSCYTLMAAVRYAFSRAVTQGTTVRLVLDFEKRTIQLEETKERVLINPEDETGEGLRSKEEEALRLGETGADEKDESDSFLDLSSTSASPFGSALPSGMEYTDDGTIDMTGFMDMLSTYDGTSASGLFGNAAGYRRPTFKALPGKRGKPRELAGESGFLRVFSPHEPNAREEGRAYIYFFPKGIAEHAFVQLTDGDERVYTIEIHPLSGKAVLINEEVEPEEDLEALQEADE